MKSLPHPADTAAARILKEAAHFSIALFLGAGRYARDEALSLAGARIAGARLEAAHPNGRKALVYAISTEGREALVTPAVLAALEALRAEEARL